MQRQSVLRQVASADELARVAKEFTEAFDQTMEAARAQKLGEAPPPLPKETPFQAPEQLELAWAERMLAEAIARQPRGVLQRLATDANDAAFTQLVAGARTAAELKRISDDKGYGLAAGLFAADTVGIAKQALLAYASRARAALEGIAVRGQPSYDEVDRAVADGTVPVLAPALAPAPVASAAAASSAPAKTPVKTPAKTPLETPVKTPAKTAASVAAAASSSTPAKTPSKAEILRALGDAKTKKQVKEVAEMAKAAGLSFDEKTARSFADASAERAKQMLARAITPMSAEPPQDNQVGDGLPRNRNRNNAYRTTDGHFGELQVDLLALANGRLVVKRNGRNAMAQRRLEPDTARDLLALLTKRVQQRPYDETAAALFAEIVDKARVPIAASSQKHRMVQAARAGPDRIQQLANAIEAAAASRAAGNTSTQLVREFRANLRELVALGAVAPAQATAMRREFLQ